MNPSSYLSEIKNGHILKLETILVTGCTGAVGSRITRILLKRGYKVNGLRHLTACEINHKEHSCQSGNLLDLDFVNQIDFSGIDQLIHTAWNVEQKEFWESKANFNWLECSKTLFSNYTKVGGRKISCIGSCAEYAWENEHPISEENKCTPTSNYGKAKLDLLSFLKSLETEYLWCRAFFLYGKELRQNKLFTYLNDEYSLGHQPALLEPESRLDYIHIDDASLAISNLIAGNHIGIFNIASGNAVSNLEIAYEFQKLYKSENLPLYSSPQSVQKIVLSDISKLRKADSLFRPRTVEIGIQEYALSQM